MPIFRRTTVLSQHLVSSLSVNGCTVCWLREDRVCLLSTGILCSRLQRVTISDAVIIQLSPENGHVYARNMSRIVTWHTYCYRIKKLCIKLVIETSLYYDARSEKHQIMKTIVTPGSEPGTVLWYIFRRVCKIVKSGY